MDSDIKLSTNSIAFIGLANEYCNVIESVQNEAESNLFIESMLKLLPRLYIAATDISTDTEPDIYIDTYLDEDYYDSIRRHIETLLGPDDVYLEVFEADMKYSDTPIGASIAESLSDIFQDLYNFITSIKDAPDNVANEIIEVCKENFKIYWGQTLCNVLRALHNLKYNSDN